MVSRYQRFGLAALFAAMMCLPAMAGPQGGGKPGGGNGAGGKGPGGGGRPTPAAMAARMIQQFDRDGDQSLNANELTAAIESMRSRRGSGGKGAGGQGAGGRARGGKGPGGRGPGGRGPGGGNRPKTGVPN